VIEIFEDKKEPIHTRWLRSCASLSRTVLIRLSRLTSMCRFADNRACPLEPMIEQFYLLPGVLSIDYLIVLRIGWMQDGAAIPSLVNQ